MLQHKFPVLYNATYMYTLYTTDSRQIHGLVMLPFTLSLEQTNGRTGATKNLISIPVFASVGQRFQVSAVTADEQMDRTNSITWIADSEGDKDFHQMRLVITHRQA